MRDIFIASLLVLAACGKAKAPVHDQMVSVAVMSGRPQPAPENVAVRVNEPVVVRADGLGAPRVGVFAPDGRRVPTTDSGIDHRFTPNAPGKYRVELEDAGGLVLVNIVAS